MASKKNILILSTDDTNGAGDAMVKVAELCLQMSCHVTMLVKNKTSIHNFVKEYKNPIPKIALLKKVILKIRNRLGVKKTISELETNPKYLFFSSDESAENIDVDYFLETLGFNPDFIFVGLTFGFMNSTDIKKIKLKSGARVFNITVDMNHFTGGCHYSWGCKGYVTDCKECPAILSEEKKNLAFQNLKIKSQNAKEAGFEIIAGSGLTWEQARVSKIYKDQQVIFNINSLIDTTILNPLNRDIAKKVFGFDDKRYYILLGAYYLNDERKGFYYLEKTMKIVEEKLEKFKSDKITIVVVSKFNDRNILKESKFAKVHVNFIKDYRLLSLLYQASDLFINSSIEDSGPMMVSEALACGTPVVGFDTGILRNMVVDGKNGFKAEVGDSEQLAEAIIKMINVSKSEYAEFSRYSIQMVEKYSSFDYAKRIFEKIIYSS